MRMVPSVVQHQQPSQLLSRPYIGQFPQLMATFMVCAPTAAAIQLNHVNNHTDKRCMSEQMQKLISVKFKGLYHVSYCSFW